MLTDTPMELGESGSPPWTRTTTTRLTGGHAALTSAGNGSSARYRAAVSRLSGGCSALELRRMGKMVAVSGIAPDSARLQRAANLSQLHSRGSPVRNRTAVCRLQGGGSAIELRGNKGWSRAPVPPRVSPRPKRGGLLSSSRANYAGMTESSSRSVNEMRSLVFCLLSSVFCLLSSVFCLLSSVFCLTVFCLTVFCLMVWMAGAGIEPAHGRRMRPLPFLLATPRLKNGGLCR